MYIYYEPPKPPVQVCSVARPEQSVWPPKSECETLTYVTLPNCLSEIGGKVLKDIGFMNSFVTTSGTNLGSQTFSGTSSFVLGTNSLGDRI